MPRFTSGDLVVVRDDAPAHAHPGAAAEVVSVTPIETPALAMRVGFPIGTVMYLVEYGDGSDQELPEEWLRPGDE